MNTMPLLRRPSSSTNGLGESPDLQRSMSPHSAG